MSKIIIKSTGNIILFLLFGLAFLFPASEFRQTGEIGFGASPTIFPLLLVLYLVAYPIVYHILQKALRWDKKDNSELTFSDEREKMIVAEATKVSYVILTGGLLFSIAAIGGVRLFSLFIHQDISIYFTGVLLLTAVLIISSLAYCIKWCVEYRK